MTQITSRDESVTTIPTRHLEGDRGQRENDDDVDVA
eukprot:CAMPEP_0172510098 /NCGR_PEP_ID=MMETSP1066-20121228/226179_1 /TAXON_ID=671091 /ORGANISM="Coscinodiscus wailesii, Strain CCMP2513" /LENGTH=35 /DNA_ID= /DNA_START= /DNA_END= /DNA_ORIENTATION=